MKATLKQQLVRYLSIDMELWRDGAYDDLGQLNKEQAREFALKESTEDAENLYMDEVKEGAYTLEEYTEVVNEALDKVYGK